MSLNGGYVMLKADDTALYTKALNALTYGKPILFYEDDKTCYYIDSASIDGTNIVLTKGGKTITIADDGTITSSGDIQNHLYALILDIDALTIDEGNIESGTNYCITILSSIKYSTLNELPKGMYSCYGADVVSCGDTTLISYIEIGDNSASIVCSNGDTANFTFNENTTFESESFMIF